MEVDASGSRRARRTRGERYEYRVLTFEPDVARDDARRLLTDEAEYGRWELARSATYVGGKRRVWLRRRIMTVTSTLRA